MSETVERKPFKSIHIDTEKGIYLLNGEEMPKAHLSVKKIADGYAECDVRLTAGHKK